MSSIDLRLQRRALLASLLMAGTAGVGQALVPTHRMAAARQGFKLDALVPRQFGDWTAEPFRSGGIVNPQTEAMLAKLYSQLLDRTYVNSRGQRIMMSVAYGEDQSDASVQLHYPEVCYPAQGFQLQANQPAVIHTQAGDIRGRRLETHFGDARFEPVTYWIIIGDQQSASGWDKKRSEILHGLRGDIVDGLLFRLSSIDRDMQAGFRVQAEFIDALVGVMSPDARRQLVGLP